MHIHKPLVSHCMGSRNLDNKVQESLWCSWGNSTKVAAVAVGVISLYFGRNLIFLLKTYLYVLYVGKNLILVSILSKDGYYTFFGVSVVIRKCKLYICYGILVGNLYIINLITSMMQHMALNNTSSNSYKNKGTFQHELNISFTPKVMSY